MLRALPTVCFAVAFGVHYVLQARAGRMFSGELFDTGGVGERWRILSFPLFTFAPSGLLVEHFHIFLLANSVIWATAITWLLATLLDWLGTGARPRQVGRVTATSFGPAPATVADASGSETQRRTSRRFSSRAGVRTIGDGRYELGACIGAGAFGMVYKARDVVRQLEVAVKILDLSAIPPEKRAQFRHTFQQEASIAGRLDHHGIVPVFDHNAQAEQPYIVMSLMSGGTLRQRLDALPRGEHLGWFEVVEIGVQVAEALEYARQKGVKAHRDIKPANIFRGDSGYKVGDFGVARAQAEQRQAQSFAAGTPGYMSPEQLLNPETVDWRSDQFSLCAVLYEALSGRLPYKRVSVERGHDQAPLAMHFVVTAASTRLVPVRELAPEVPVHVAKVIEQGLQFDRLKRLPNWGEFVRILRGEPRSY